MGGRNDDDEDYDDHEDYYDDDDDDEEEDEHEHKSGDVEPVVTFECSRCGGVARLDLRGKSWADTGRSRVYFGDCPRCGVVRKQRPIDCLDDVVCATCAGRMSWATELDSYRPLNEFPLVCSACARLATAGVRFTTPKQHRIVSKLHKLDDKFDAYWLNVTMLAQNESMVDDRSFRRYTRQRGAMLTERRERLRNRLMALSERDHAQVVSAQMLRGESTG